MDKRDVGFFTAGLLTAGALLKIDDWLRPEDRRPGKYLVGDDTIIVTGGSFSIDSCAGFKASGDSKTATYLGGLTNLSTIGILYKDPGSGTHTDVPPLKPNSTGTNVIAITYGADTITIKAIDTAGPTPGSITIISSQSKLGQNGKNVRHKDLESVIGPVVVTLNGQPGQTFNVDKGKCRIEIK